VQGSIDKINVNNNMETGPKKIANTFNNYFSSIGAQILKSIIPTETKSEDYHTANPNINDLEFDKIRSMQIFDIIKLMQPQK
jgi:hypothetical protein